MLLKPAPSLWRDLRRGMFGHDVAAWQAVQAYEPRPEDWQGNWPIKVDGDFGDQSERATRAYQSRRALPVTGVVDAATRGTIDAIFFAPEPTHEPDADGLPPIQFIQARDWRWANRTTVDWIVLHSAEVGEFASSAEAVAYYFKNPKVPSSAHFIVDNDSIVQCVKTEHMAAHANSANRRSIGVEQAGYAKQTRAEWLDAYGQSMLGLLAKLLRRECRTWNIPIERLSAADLLNGRRGLTDHVTVNEAFKQSKHWDCGPNYPWDVVLDLTRKAA